jgi:hypothetical protein
MEPNPRRTWLQFSIKSLLLVTLLAASFLGGMASIINSYEDAESRARVDRAARDKAEAELRRVVEDEIDFKERHGISGIVRLRDLDLNEWGVWQPKSEPIPQPPRAKRKPARTP